MAGKLFKLHKDRTTIAGVAVGSNGTVTHEETGVPVSPMAGLRSGKTCIVSIGEGLTFLLEEASTAKVPVVGQYGQTVFDAQELVRGTVRGAGIKGTAALSTVVSVRRTFAGGGVPAIEVVVAVESADEEASGMAWTAGEA
jgi:hypothetical protein